MADHQPSWNTYSPLYIGQSPKPLSKQSPRFYSSLILCICDLCVALYKAIRLPENGIIIIIMRFSGRRNDHDDADEERSNMLHSYLILRSKKNKDNAINLHQWDCRRFQCSIYRSYWYQNYIIQLIIKRPNY